MWKDKDNVTHNCDYLEAGVGQWQAASIPAYPQALNIILYTYTRIFIQAYQDSWKTIPTYDPSAFETAIFGYSSFFIISLLSLSGKLPITASVGS